MTDPGWDIPGLPRDDPPGTAAARSASGARPDPDAGQGLSAEPGESRRNDKRRTKGRLAASVSALGGPSASAFARPASNTGPSQDDASSSAPAWSSPTASSPDGAVRPDSPAEALAYLSGALDFLAHADPAEWPEGLQADCLRALAVAESRQAAAHAKVLSAFSVPGGGLAGDGHRSPRVWLTWQCAARRCLT